MEVTATIKRSKYEIRIVREDGSETVVNGQREVYGSSSNINILEEDKSLTDEQWRELDDLGSACAEVMRVL